MRFAKVIYDWGVNDVFKYIHDMGADYCDFYDYAALSGANQRVGIPLHSVIYSAAARDPSGFENITMSVRFSR